MNRTQRNRTQRHRRKVWFWKENKDLKEKEDVQIKNTPTTV